MNYIHPLPKGSYTLSQGFGANPDNGTNPAGGHTGDDYAAPEGTPVYAIADGVVEFEGVLTGTYANNPWWLVPEFAGVCLVIDHGDGRPDAVYGHLSATLVNNGDTIKQGQIIGLLGTTGLSSGPHLHFEILPPGYNLGTATYGRSNPADWITAHRTEQEEPMPTAHEIARAVLTYQVPYKDPLTGADTGQTTSLATMAGFADFQAAATRRDLANQAPASIAAQLNAAGIAAQVRDELVNLLKG